MEFIIAPFQEETFVWDNDPWESIIHMTSLSWTPFGVMPEVSFKCLCDPLNAFETLLDTLATLLSTFSTLLKDSIRY